MATSIRWLTYDNLESIPQERPGDRHELIAGELFVTPVPIFTHQTVGSNIVFKLEGLVRRERLGSVRTAPAGVRLAPDTLVIPDVYFMARDRLDRLDLKAIEVAPDLIVEILSPGTRRRDLAVKRALYARFGVREYWIVDPAATTVLILVLNEDRYEEAPLSEHGTIVSRVLPGLQLGLDEVFTDVPRRHGLKSA